MVDLQVVRMVTWQHGMEIAGLEEYEGYPQGYGWIRSWTGIGPRMVYPGDRVIVLAPRGLIVVPRHAVVESVTEVVDGAG